MRRIVLTSPAAAGTSLLATSTGASSPAIIDFHLTPVNIGLAVEFPAGVGATTQVEYTVDDPFGATFSTTAVWFQHASLNGITSNTYGNIATPVSAVRLNNTVYSSGATGPTLTIVQSGGIA